MRRRLGISALLLGLAACHGRLQAPAAPRPGMIAGLVRDAGTGEAIANSIIVLRRPGAIEPVRDVADGNGAYMIPSVPPGRYTVHAYVAQTLVGEREAEVRPNEITGVDFTVGHVAIDSDLDTPGSPALWHYRPHGADPLTGAIEGTVADLHLARLAGAAVTVTSSGTVTTEATVTDDQGRFRIAELPPGRYDVSAFYDVVGRGQIEVRRSRVQIGGGDVVVVPLWLDTDGLH